VVGVAAPECDGDDGQLEPGESIPPSIPWYEPVGPRDAGRVAAAARISASSSSACSRAGPSAGGSGRLLLVDSQGSRLRVCGAAHTAPSRYAEIFRCAPQPGGHPAAVWACVRTRDQLD
jgi:hypothetical protein